MPALLSFTLGFSRQKVRLSVFPATVCYWPGTLAATVRHLVGEGIRFAIYSGQMAGTVAAEAVKADNTSADFLKRFDVMWRARFGRDYGYCLFD